MRGVRGRTAITIWRAAALLIASGSMLSAGAAAADGLEDRPDTPLPHFEFWSGATAFHDVWSIYSGSTVAPFGGIREDGFRLRLAGGYGEDRYSRQTPAGSLVFKGSGSFADLLLGYHAQLGPLTVKAFAGATMVERQTTPLDPVAEMLGAGWGGKALLETWLNLGDSAWTAVDLSWASVYDSYSARVRVGWRLTSALSVGLEASAIGNVGTDVAGAGAFVRYETASGELSLSAGVTTDKLREGGAGLLGVAQSGTPIANASWLTRF